MCLPRVSPAHQQLSGSVPYPRTPIRLQEADVDPSDVFFHRYFAAKEERQKLARAERKADRRKGAKKAEDGEDGDGDGDGDDEIDPDWARSAARGADQEGFESSDEEEEAALDAALAEAEAGLGDGALDGEDDIALLGARSHRAPKKPATAVSGGGWVAARVHPESPAWALSAERSTAQQVASHR